MAKKRANWLSRVLFGAHFKPSIGPDKTKKEGSMFYALLGYMHAALWRANTAVTRRVRAIHALAEGERGQGTVEYAA